jgi:predicted dehydrogenase
VNRVALTVHGDKGAIRIDLDKGYQLMDYCLVQEDGLATPWQTIYTGVTPNIYQRFTASVRTGHNDSPDFARGAEIQRYLDAAQESAATRRMVGVGPA